MASFRSVIPLFCLVAAGVLPSACSHDTGDGELGTSRQAIVSAWQPNVAYQAGDLVTYAGVTYSCVQAHTSLVGWEPPNVPALWEVDESPPAPGGSEWHPNTGFQVGDEVTYGGDTYRCLQAHTSLVGWEPPNVPALWKLLVPPEPERELCDEDPSTCCPGGATHVTLTDGADVETINGEDQCVIALGGSDTLHVTAPGTSAVIAGPGDDTVMGGPALDRFIGGSGRDTLYGYDGSDGLLGGAGDDVIFAGNGANFVVPGPGVDTVTCGNGDDTIVIYDLCEVEAGDTIDGGGGIDTLVAPVSAAELAALGVSLANVESVHVENNSCQSECAARPECPSGEVCVEGQGLGEMHCAPPPQPEAASPYASAIAGEEVGRSVSSSPIHVESSCPFGSRA